MALVFPPVRTLIGFPYVPVGVTLKAGATYSEEHYPLSNLSDGYGRFMWRNTYETAAIQLDLGYDRPVNFVGLIGHNLSHNLLVSVFASRDDTSLGLPLYPLDDELEQVAWAQMQIFARAVGVRYPNLWCDCRDAHGDPTVAQYWQVHVTDNGAPVALGEVVVGFADEYEGIIRSPYRESLYSWQTRHKLVHGPEIISGSNVVSRTMELELSITPEDRAVLDDVYAFAAAGPLDGQRVVVVPDSRRNDLWFVEWPARREATFPGASYRVAEQTITLVEETFGATPSSLPTTYVQPTPPPPIDPSIPVTMTIQWTTNYEWTAPDGGATTVNPSETSWAYSPWATMLTPPAVTTGLVLTSVHVVGPGIEGQFEVEVGVGGVGSEVIIAAVRGSFFAGIIASGTHELRLPIPIDAIPSGSRVAVRMRKAGTNAAPWYLAISYLRKPIVGNLQTSTKRTHTTSAGANATTLAGVAGWTFGAWTTLIASASADLTLVGLNPVQVFNGINWQMEIGVGAAGSEVVVGSQRGYGGGLTDGVSYIPFMNPIHGRVPLGARVSGRVAGPGGGGMPFTLLYMEGPL